MQLCKPDPSPSSPSLQCALDPVSEAYRAAFAKSLAIQVLDPFFATYHGNDIGIYLRNALITGAVDDKDRQKGL